MGTTLTGTTPQDTYDSLIKVTDNGPLGGTLKALSDGLGNDSTLSLSTTAASIAGTLAVTGNATFDTNTLVVDATNNRVGIGTSSPANTLDVGGEIKLSSDLYMGNDRFLRFVRNSGSASIQTLGIPTGTDDVRLLTTGDFNVVTGGLASLLAVKSSGNVGIGTSAPANKLSVNGDIGAASSVFSNFGSATTAVVGFADGNTGFFRPLVNTLGITVNGAEQARITSGGVLQLTQGQIKFPVTQVASSDPNTLDDYEEGTWTMGVSFGGASVDVTTSSNSGTYTKIGRQVTVNGYLQLTSKGSSTGNALITGLPFTIANNNAYYSSPSLRFNNITFTNQFQGFANINSTTIILGEITTLGAETDLTDADFANNSSIIFSLTYFV